MDPITIAGLISMVVGSAVQYNAQKEAQARQQRVIQDGLQRQQSLQMQAEKSALDQAKEFAPEDRQNAQKQIEDQVFTELNTPVAEGQKINSASSTTQGDVSNDYSTAKAASDVNQLKMAETMARLLGKTTSAGRLRQNEALRMAETGQNIDRFGSFSRGQAGASNADAQTAGQVDAGQMLLGGLLSAAGSAGASGGFSGSSAATPGVNVGTGVTPGNAGIGFTGAGGVGLKMGKIPALTFGA